MLNINIKNKRAFSGILMAALLLTALLSSCSFEPKEKADLKDTEIIEAFYANFLKLTEIPRPSHHEEKISDFLFSWAEDKGYEPVRDESRNVMFDVPATSGKENKPLVALQVHMDMVAVGGEGFDPLTDPIKPIRNDETGTVTADGTSLGADDGAGIAMVMTYLESGEEHGPLRIIITTNEEDGMSGTFNMDQDWVKELKYLINLDAEDSTAMIVSTAAGDIVSGTKGVETAAPSGSAALSVTISGLAGGHSGVEIDKGRCNGIIALGGFLKELSAENIAFEIASFEGGSAPNAIPKDASCVIVVDEGNGVRVKSLAGQYLSKLNSDFQGIENGIIFDVSDVETPNAVISGEDSVSAVSLIEEIIDGVYTMSAEKEGLVESSSNLGLFSLGEEGFTFMTYVRSSVAEKQTEIVDSEIALAEKCGFTVTCEKSADPWPYNPDNILMDLAAKVYKEQNASEFEQIAVHAGLECGSYAVYNPDLMMISIGPDLKDVHTPKETLMLNSVPKVYKLLCGILLEVE